MSKQKQRTVCCCCGCWFLFLNSAFISSICCGARYRPAEKWKILTIYSSLVMGFDLSFDMESQFKLFGATKKCQAKTCFANQQIGIKKTIIPCQLTLNIIAIFLFSASLKCIVVFSSISLFYIIYSFSVWLLFFCCCLFSFALSHVLCEKTEIEQTVTITTVNFLSIDAVHK